MLHNVAVNVTVAIAAIFTVMWTPPYLEFQCKLSLFGPIATKDTTMPLMCIV